MELQYYVLGKRNNPMLLSYLDKYYKKLCGILEALVKEGVLVEEIQQLLKKDNRQFILNADISSLIDILNTEVLEKNHQGLLHDSEYQEIFRKEISFFLAGEHEKLSMNQGEKIGDTNIRLSLSDLNPYSENNAHPEHVKTGGVVGWGEKSEKEWLEVYTKTFEALKIVDASIYDELNQIIHKIVPLGTSYGVHNSCSHRNCIGHLYMGYTVDVERPEFSNLEAVIHESSHNKLNLIMQSEPIILNDREEKYYSPYRPDARPIHGVYIGLHAFAPVIYILMKAYKKGLLGDSVTWIEKIMLYYLKNKFCYRVLIKHGKFTKLGEEILAEMKYVMDLTDKVFLSMPEAREVLIRVQQYQKQHFSGVNDNYPHLQY